MRVGLTAAGTTSGKGAFENIGGKSKLAIITEQLFGPEGRRARG